MKEDLVEIDVCNSKGFAWHEQWTKEKLAYFILMSDLITPKFDRAVQIEWVPFEMNKYRWDKGRLSREEFELIASSWPGRTPVPFDPRSCDRVQIVYRKTPVEATGFGFDPKREPGLFERLVGIGAEKLRYEAFDYAFARHVFNFEFDDQSRSALLKSGPRALWAMLRVRRGFIQMVRGTAGTVPRNAQKLPEARRAPRNTRRLAATTKADYREGAKTRRREICFYLRVFAPSR